MNYDLFNFLDPSIAGCDEVFTVTLCPPVEVILSSPDARIANAGDRRNGILPLDYGVSAGHR